MKQDPKLVAEQQPHEIAYIAQKFGVTTDEVKKIMFQLGKKGKYCRSRKMIYPKVKELVTEKASQANNMV